MNDYLELLGKKCKDRVTGFVGVVSSVCFDLYGCVQVILAPGMLADGKLGDGHCFDWKRIEILDSTPVMPRPSYEKPGKEIGCAERPKS